MQLTLSSHHCHARLAKSAVPKGVSYKMSLLWGWNPWAASALAISLYPHSLTPSLQWTALPLMQSLWSGLTTRISFPSAAKKLAFPPGLVNGRTGSWLPLMAKKRIPYFSVYSLRMAFKASILAGWPSSEKSPGRATSWIPCSAISSNAVRNTTLFSLNNRVEWSCACILRNNTGCFVAGSLGKSALRIPLAAATGACKWISAIKAICCFFSSALACALARGNKQAPQSR